MTPRGAVEERRQGAAGRFFDGFFTQIPVVLPELSWSVDADQDFSSVLADWSGHGR
jgi:hypothetical protein